MQWQHLSVHYPLRPLWRKSRPPPLSKLQTKQTPKHCNHIKTLSQLKKPPLSQAWELNKEILQKKRAYPFLHFIYTDKQAHYCRNKILENIFALSSCWALHKVLFSLLPQGAIQLDFHFFYKLCKLWFENFVCYCIAYVKPYEHMCMHHSLDLQIRLCLGTDTYPKF